MPKHYLGDYKLVLTKNHASSVEQTIMVQCQEAAMVQFTSTDIALDAVETQALSAAQVQLTSKAAW